MLTEEDVIKCLIYFWKQVEDSRLSEIKGSLSLMSTPKKVVLVLLKHNLPIRSHPISLHHLRQQPYLLTQFRHCKYWD
jgi:hypothetical protein